MDLEATKFLLSGCLRRLHCLFGSLLVVAVATATVPPRGQTHWSAEAVAFNVFNQYNTYIVCACARVYVYLCVPCPETRRVSAIDFDLYLSGSAPYLCKTTKISAPSCTLPSTSPKELLKNKNQNTKTFWFLRKNISLPLSLTISTHYTHTQKMLNTTSQVNKLKSWEKSFSTSLINNSTFVTAHSVAIKSSHFTKESRSPIPSQKVKSSFGQDQFFTCPHPEPSSCSSTKPTAQPYLPSPIFSRL